MMSNTSLPKTNLYYRYLDDPFIVSGYLLENSDFQVILTDLKFNLSNSKTVNFLYFNITLNIYEKIEFNLNIKPINTFSNLLYSYRIRRVCSKKED